MELYYEYKTVIHKVDVEQKSGTWEIRIKDRLYTVSGSQLGNRIQITTNGLQYHPRVYCNGQKRFIFLNGETYCLKKTLHFSGTHDHVEGEILSPIGGKIVRVFVSEGEIVTKNQDLLIIESMKMEHRVKAPVKGTVMRLHYGEGAIIDTGEVLVDMERDKTANGQGEW